MARMKIVGGVETGGTLYVATHAPIHSAKVV